MVGKIQDGAEAPAKVKAASHDGPHCPALGSLLSSEREAPGPFTGDAPCEGLLLGRSAEIVAVRGGTTSPSKAMAASPS